MNCRYKRFLFFLFILCSNSVYSQKWQEAEEDSFYYFDPVSHEQEVINRSIHDTLFKKVSSDDDYWYVNQSIASQKKSPAKTNNIFLPPWVKTSLWVIIIGSFIAVLIWYIIVSDISLFRKTPKILTTTDQSLIEENIFSIEYDNAITTALKLKDYRLAIRLLYLQTLKVLSEKNKITYKHDKTNTDYLYELNNTKYYKDFFRLTRNFEYVWYGQFSISKGAYTLISNNFQQFKSEVE